MASETCKKLAGSSDGTMMQKEFDNPSISGNAKSLGLGESGHKVVDKQEVEKVKEEPNHSKKGTAEVMPTVEDDVNEKSKI